MKLSYDPKYNIAYLRLQAKTGPVTTLRLSDELNVDIAADGTVYGFELLNAKVQLAEDGGRFVFDWAVGSSFCRWRHDLPTVAPVTR